MLRHPTVKFESQLVVCIPQNLWWYSPECLELFTTFRGMFGDIPQNDWWHSPEYLATFPGIFGDIPRNVWRHSPTCLATFPGIQHSPYSPRSPHSVPRSCIPGFIHSRCLPVILLKINGYGVSATIIIAESKTDLILLGRGKL